MASFRQRLFIQAAITGIFALLPSGSGESSWLAVTLLLAAASAAIAVLLPNLAAAAYQTALGFEVVAVTVGGYAMTQGTYIPGTIVGIAALIRLFDPSVKAGFAAGQQAQPYAQQPYQPPAQLGQQFGVPPQQPQYGQQLGVPQYAPAPQYAPPAYAPPPYTQPQGAPVPLPPPPPAPAGAWPPPPPPA